MGWVEQAESLPLGTSRKIAHCGADKSAHIKRTHAGVSLYCHRCQEKEFKPVARISPQDYAELIRREKERIKAKDYGPQELLSWEETPKEARLFVLRAGLSVEAAQEVYGFRWLPRVRRVLIPHMHAGKKQTGVLLRRVMNDGPKYISSGIPRGAVYTLDIPAGQVVVVEDVLSAIKVYRAGYSSIAALGTSIGQETINILQSEDPILWFDADPAGQSATKKVIKAMAPFGKVPRVVQTEQDPKFQDGATIRRVIGSAL